MSKLTAEEARFDLGNLKKWQSEPHGISMKEERHMQTLEIALPILEQQEMITDSQPVITDSERMITDSAERGDGWIEWGGGTNAPVTGMVEVRLRSCSNARKAEPATDWVWKHRGTGDDIIAYRVIQEQPTNQNGEQ